MVADLQKEILRLKKEKDVCILAHSYQNEPVLEVADYQGDSFQLSVRAQEAPNSTILMCGVRFMAETVKILSPEKKVILANEHAGCPMAEQMDKEMIQAVKDDYPDFTVVAYINTTAELKTVCDVCVTSSSAVRIVNKIENKNILFIPDCNLGHYVASRNPEKNIKLLNGNCPIHAAVEAAEVEAAKTAYPNALVLVHPECKPEVVALADYVGSTAEILEFPKKSEHNEFIIGTELGVTEHLQHIFPDKKFINLSKKLICPDMKITTLMDVYQSLKGQGGEEILLDEDTLRDARKCIDEMIRLG
ncbi:MAG: quinolinate synthase NadA [Acutalibacteraceae bacterium]|jgi:quinolinate synthase